MSRVVLKYDMIEIRQIGFLRALWIWGWWSARRGVKLIWLLLSNKCCRVVTSYELIESISIGMRDELCQLQELI